MKSGLRSAQDAIPQAINDFLHIGLRFGCWSFVVV